MAKALPPPLIALIHAASERKMHAELESSGRGSLADSSPQPNLRTPALTLTLTLALTLALTPTPTPTPTPTLTRRGDSCGRAW